MTLSVLLLNDSPVPLWELSSKERLQRQMREMGGIEWVEEMSDLPATGMVLLLDGNYLFEIRTFRKLMEQPDSILHCASNGRPAAAFVSAGHAVEAAAYMVAPDSSEHPATVKRLESADLPALACRYPRSR